MLKKKLYEIANVQAGGTPSRTKSEYWNGDIPWVKISNINSKFVTEYDETITNDGLNNSSAKYFSKGTILYTIFATLGRVGILTFDATTNQAIAGIKLIDNSLTNDYLYYYLRSLESHVKNIGNGAAQQNINLSILKNFEVPIVSIDIQNKITSELKEIEMLLEIKINVLLSLDELIKSRFIEMFDSESNKEKLVNLCKFINGDRGKNYPSASDRITSGIPFINAGHLENNVVCFDNMDYISKQKYESLSSGKVQKDDIIYCLRGSLGKKGIVNFDKGAIASSLLILRTNSKIRPLFLLYSLDQEYVLAQMKASNNGSSQPNLSAQSVKQYDIILPTIDRQIEFESYVRLIDKSKFVCYSKYFLCDNFTLESSTIAYSNVVSIFAWPNRC